MDCFLLCRFMSGTFIVLRAGDFILLICIVATFSHDNSTVHFLGNVQQPCHRTPARTLPKFRSTAQNTNGRPGRYLKIYGKTKKQQKGRTRQQLPKRNKIHPVKTVGSPKVTTFFDSMFNGSNLLNGALFQVFGN